MEALTTVKPFEWLTIAAIVLGPIFAVQAEKLVEARRERTRARRGLFHTLMRTRAARVSPQHVEALNSINFYFRKDKRVVEAWKIYFDHLNTPYPEKENDNWARRAEDCFVKLLTEMAAVLGYVFDEVQIRRGIYAPRAHEEAESDSLVIRRSLAEILSGKRVIPVYVVPPITPAAQVASAKAVDPRAADAWPSARPRDGGGTGAL
jgi:hypothetical protein